MSDEAVAAEPARKAQKTSEAVGIVLNAFEEEPPVRPNRDIATLVHLPPAEAHLVAPFSAEDRKKKTAVK
jgi:hypothetical protein